jgi:glycosyltransferase involved in cell wall biosynthesis
MTKMALKVRNQFPDVRVIFDCRGDEVAEFIGRHELGEDPAKWPPLLRKQYDTIVKLQRSAVCEADAVCCVSKAMAKELSTRYAVPMSRFHVIPCCTDIELFPVEESHRTRIRNALGLTDRFVVTYCGSLEFYQLPDQAIRVYRIIRGIEPRAHFLGITTHPERMRTLATSEGIQPTEMTVLRLPPAEVPKYLMASDVGLLLRRTDAINRVAAPVKFAEYLASGTPVIITEGIGDYSQTVAEHGLGVVVNIDWPDKSLADRLSEFCAIYARGGQEIRERCLRYAKEYLSWTVQTNKVAKLYDELAHL